MRFAVVVAMWGESFFGDSFGDFLMAMVMVTTLVYAWIAVIVMWSDRRQPVRPYATMEPIEGRHHRAQAHPRTHLR